MNDYHFLILAERLVSLYSNGQILTDEKTLSKEFIALVRETEDTLSNVE